MGKLLTISLILVAIPVRPDRPAPPAVPVPGNPLLGHWKLVSFRMAGQEDLSGSKQDATLHITPTHMHVIEKGTPQAGQEMSYKIDWTRHPAAIDLTPKNGPGERLEGILKIEGDRLFLCITPSPGKRPTSFDPFGNDDVILLQLVRVNK